jgi:hypothetical protein
MNLGVRPLMEEGRTELRLRSVIRRKESETGQQK